MPRPLQPSFVITLGVLSLGCSGMTEKLGVPDPFEGDPPHGNPPPPLANTAVTWSAPPFTLGQSIEARDADRRIIRHANDACWVELPYEGEVGSWRPPPTQPVACPEALLNDPAFDTCAGGTIHLQQPPPELTCVCYFSGNPPPAAKPVACPTIAVPTLMDATSHPITSRNPPAPDL